MRLLPLLSVAGLATGLVAVTVAAWQPRDSRVHLLETPAGPGSGMYSLSPPDPRRASERAPILSWIDVLPDGGHALRYATLEGSRWSAPREVARGTNWFANWADHPSVVRDGDGLLAHWLVRSGAGTSRYGYGLRVARSTDGGTTWTPVVTVEPENTKDYAGFVAFARGPHVPGAAYLAPPPATAGTHTAPPAAGIAHPEPQKALLFARFLPDGRIGIDLLDSDTCSCCTVSVSSATRGPLIVYRDRKDGEVRDISAIRWQGTGWSTPVTVHADGWVLPGCPTNGPAVSADADRVAVAWFTAAGGKPRVRVAFSRDGGATFGAPRDVDDGAPIGWTGIVLTDDGDAIVSWLESQPGGGGQVRLRRVREGEQSGPSLVVADTRSGRATGIPQLSRSGDVLVLAWRDERVRTALVPMRAVEPAGPSSRP